MDLFSQNKEIQSKNRSGPLPERVRPQRLEEIFGHHSLLGENEPLRRLIDQDQKFSFILWGPPGIGKTTLARAIANHTEKYFIGISAVMAGTKEIKEAAATARLVKATQNLDTLLFIDEIHRLNKVQQDALLPFVEDGTFSLIGATTENPGFELSSALTSRAPVFSLKPLTRKDIFLILKRALSDIVHGLGALQVPIPEVWLEEISEISNGDARRGLLLLDQVAHFLKTELKKQNKHSFDLTLDRVIFEKALGDENRLRYDHSGEEHYNTISAFIKSMRDSDPDAALYYLARMLRGGEDPLFIARRLVVFASEDIGNADPRALSIAIDIKNAVEFVGLPESRINLAHGVTYFSMAPKSNASYEGITKALSEVELSGNLEIPLHLRNAPIQLMKNLGYGKNYDYPHSNQDGFSGQINLPDEISGKLFYRPKESGLEKQIKVKLAELRSLRKKDGN